MVGLSQGLLRGRDLQGDRTIRFDRTTNAPTTSTAEEWKSLSNRYGATTYFSPIPVTETLTSNLLEVRRYAPRLYRASALHLSSRSADRPSKKLKSTRRRSGPSKAAPHLFTRSMISRSVHGTVSVRHQRSSRSTPKYRFVGCEYSTRESQATSRRAFTNDRATELSEVLEEG